MLIRFRRALVISAAGRNLAIDMFAEHGSRALAMLDAIPALENATDGGRDILLKARQELEKLNGL